MQKHSVGRRAKVTPPLHVVLLFDKCCVLFVSQKEEKLFLLKRKTTRMLKASLKNLKLRDEKRHFGNEILKGAKMILNIAVIQLQ